MPKTEILSLEVLRLDGDTQSRLEPCKQAVEEYADAIVAAGKDWPFGPLDVFFDGSDYWLADGFHRTLAGIAAERSSAPCRVHLGTSDDARIFGMTANDKHGVRMTPEDRRKNVVWLLKNRKNMPQTEIAAKAGVSDRTVRRIVAELNESKKRTVSGGGTTVKEPAKPAANKPAAAKEKATTESKASVVLDERDRPIPPKFRESNELGIQLMSTGRELDKYRQKAKEFSEQPGGEWLRLQDVDEHVRDLKNLFQHARYNTACTICDGNGKSNGAKCKKCDGIGWIPDYLKGTVN